MVQTLIAFRSDTCLSPLLILLAHCYLIPRGELRVAFRKQGNSWYTTLHAWVRLQQLELINLVTWLVKGYFEPSQPQRITSRLKAIFNLSPFHFARKSSNHKLFKNQKISLDTNLHETKHTQTSNNFFSKN